MNINSNIINRYDDMLYENRPVSLNEFLSNKYNNVHNELYKSALDKYIHSLVDKYVTSKLIYEYYELLSKIGALKEDDIVFEDIYNSIFSNENESPFITNMLNELSIDRATFFKLFYDITVNKLNDVKYKLLNFYRDDNYNIKSAITGILEISDIHDFRLAYIISGIGSETNNDKTIFTLYTDDNGELLVSNKVIFDNDSNQEYSDKNMYYYIGTELPSQDSHIDTNSNNWNIINETEYTPIVKHYYDYENESWNSFANYYIAIPVGYGIYRNNIEQTAISHKTQYEYIKSIIIDKILYNIYLTTLNVGDIIKINENTIITDVDDDFDLICSEGNNYIILYDFSNNVRIGYDENGKWLLVVNNDNPINTVDIVNLENIIKQYINYESQNIVKLYKNLICDLYKKYHKIIEIKNSEYWMPSHARIINKISPYKKITVNLSKYWNMNQSNSESKLSDLKISKENILDSELVEINYVNGKAKIQSRINDITYEVPFKYLDENINISDDMILSNTFVNKI